MDPLARLSQIDPKAKTLSLLEEFKGFAFKGNVIDLAVGVIIGGAFGKIVESLVKNIIMPFVSVILPTQQKYVDWNWTIRGQPIPYGLFLGEVVNFLIVAAALFVFIVKLLGWIMKARSGEAAPIPPSKQEVLLTEIRDLLRESAAKSDRA